MALKTLTALLTIVGFSLPTFATGSKKQCDSGWFVQTYPGCVHGEHDPNRNLPENNITVSDNSGFRRGSNADSAQTWCNNVFLPQIQSTYNGDRYKFGPLRYSERTRKNLNAGLRTEYDYTCTITVHVRVPTFGYSEHCGDATMSVAHGPWEEVVNTPGHVPESETCIACDGYNLDEPQELQEKANCLVQNFTPLKDSNVSGLTPDDLYKYYISLNTTLAADDANRDTRPEPTDDTHIHAFVRAQLEAAYQELSAIYDTLETLNDNH